MSTHPCPGSLTWTLRQNVAEAAHATSYFDAVAWGGEKLQEGRHTDTGLGNKELPMYPILVISNRGYKNLLQH